MAGCTARVPEANSRAEQPKSGRSLTGRPAALHSRDHAASAAALLAKVAPAGYATEIRTEVIKQWKEGPHKVLMSALTCAPLNVTSSEGRCDD